MYDIPQADQPDAIVEHLRQKWTDHKDSPVLCSVTEIEGRGKGILATTMLLNAKLKKLCKNFKVPFIDVSRDLYKDAREKDGVHYRGKG